MPRRPRNVLPKRGIYHGTRRRFRWRLHVATLMDNHVHLVVETRRGRLSRGMHRLAGIYAQRFNRRYDRVGHLFQARFSAFVIEDEEHFVNACTYVLGNPVRARLCGQAEEWPWSWSRFAAAAARTTEPRRGRPRPAPAPAGPAGRS